jgi:hypothetical protein
MNFIGNRHGDAKLLAAVRLVGCGGGGASGSANTVFVAHTASKTLGRAKGTLSATAAQCIDVANTASTARQRIQNLANAKLTVVFLSPTQSHITFVNQV